MLRAACILVTAIALPPTVAFAQSPVERGQKVYATEKCVVCHAIAGQGNKRGSLDGVASKLSADEIRQWIVSAADMTAKTNATSKPVMKSYAHLAKDDLDALVAYMQ